MHFPLLVLLHIVVVFQRGDDMWQAGYTER